MDIKCLPYTSMDTRMLVMSTGSWPAKLTSTIGREVRRLRQERGLTAAELSGACAALGMEVPSRTITNWETGKRATIAVTDLLVVAEALNVPPISLLFPLGQDDRVEVLPGRDAAMWDAVAWFTDEAHLDQAPALGSARAALDAFRGHAAAVHTALTSVRIREERRRQPGANLEHADAMLEDDLRALRELRGAMRAEGWEPPPVPSRLEPYWIAAEGDAGQAEGAGA